jgi:hypothetical protein
MEQALTSMPKGVTLNDIWTKLQIMDTELRDLRMDFQELAEREDAANRDVPVHGLPGEAGCAKRLAKADEYWKSGGKGVSLQELDQGMCEAIARGAAYGRAHGLQR